MRIRYPYELRQITYFLAVVKYGNITRASKRLFITQPALSQQLKKLEENIGEELFVRGTERMDLTPTGEVFLKYAEKINNFVEKSLIELGENNSLFDGVVKIGALQSVTNYMLPMIISKLAIQYPNIKLVVDECSSIMLENKICSGDIDFGLGFSPPESKYIIYEALFKEDFLMFSTKRHKFSELKSLEFKCMHNENIITFPSRFRTRNILDRISISLGIHPNIKAEINSISSILSSVHESNIPTILPKLAGKLRESKDLVTIPFVKPTPFRELSMLYHREYRCTQNVLYVIETIKKMVQSKEF